ncbi:MAG TPA: ABC transporter ATP-binding protein [Woeseiaceae bacterium]|nr:ABC transporter ATP-binding protein [Woeseiaceae bacterium]
MSRGSILEVKNLSIAFPQSATSTKTVVDGVSFSIERGRTMGLVGESGSGKSMIALSILGLVPGGGIPVSGQILLNGRNLLEQTTSQVRRIRGSEVSIVFQDPLASLNPVRPVGSLLVRSAMMHQGCSEQVARNRAADMLSAVGIPTATQRMRSYPHEFSGGQRQRIMVALAMINNPSLIIADEPTTSLDATVQIQILDLLKSFASECSLLLITHDLTVTAGVCDRVAVLRNGKIVESGDAYGVLNNPKDPYTQTLVDAVPRFEGHRFVEPKSLPLQDEDLILEVHDLDVTYIQSGRSFNAVEDISISLERNGTLGIVGESGSGKSTIAKALMQMVRPSRGRVLFDGIDLRKANQRDSLAARRRIQYVFQDPYASLDPRWRIGRIIAEPMRIHKVGSRKEIREQVARLIEQVELPDDSIDRYPAEFSGGQRQRIAIARSLSVNPDLLIADEPVSSLDVTIQLKVVRLLKSLQKQYDLSLIIIAHDLPLVYQMTDRVAVVYLGQIVEQGPTEVVLRNPKHPYTASLISASSVESFESVADGLRNAGESASILDPPSGCRFHPRCPIATTECSVTVPMQVFCSDGTIVSCHHSGKIGRK